MGNNTEQKQMGAQMGAKKHSDCNRVDKGLIIHIDKGDLCGDFMPKGSGNERSI